MPYNKIITKKALGTVISASGKKLAISAATQTDTWQRPDFAAELLKESLEKAIQANEDVIPSGTVEVCSREADHKSESDSRTHITAVCFDKNGKGKTVHLPTLENKK